MDTTEKTYWRISDTQRCGQILANRIPDLAQAQHVLELLQLDYPELELVIESYTHK